MELLKVRNMTTSKVTSVELSAGYRFQLRRRLDRNDLPLFSSAGNHPDIVPYDLSPLLLIQFMMGISKLESLNCSTDSGKVRAICKKTLKVGKKTIKNSAKVAQSQTETYRLMAIYYWFFNKQKKALKWFDKSIKEGEKLRAKPELSRTYFEVGKRLLEPQSKYKHLNGITAEEYLEKARVMFEEMDLQWDLEQLEKIKRGEPVPIV